MALSQCPYLSTVISVALSQCPISVPLSLCNNLIISISLFSISFYQWHYLSKPSLLQFDRKLAEMTELKDKEIAERDAKLSRLKQQMADSLKGNSW